MTTNAQNHSEKLLEKSKTLENLRKININTFFLEHPSEKKIKKEYNYDDVLADLTKCLQIKPGFYLAYFNRANVNANFGNYSDAINDYTLAIINEPEFSEAYFNRGLTYIHIKNKNKGCLDMSKAGELGFEKAYEVIKRYCK